MDFDRTCVRAGLGAVEAEEAALHLLALGIEAEIARDRDGTCSIVVSEDDAHRAHAVLEVTEEERAREAGDAGDAVVAPDAAAAAQRRPGPREDALVSSAGTAAVVAVAAVCVAAFLWTTHGALEASYARMLEAGAVLASRVDRGEAWRLVTAVFLHFDLAHLIANMAVLLVLGPLLAHLLGPARFVAVFVASGVAGNVASYVLAPSPSLKAGASGAVAGVLGALAGQALARGRSGRFAQWQVLGAIAVAYALLVGAGSGRDHVAHLAGLLAGVALGRALAPQPLAASPVRSWE